MKSVLWLGLTMLAASYATTSNAQTPQITQDIQSHIRAIESGLVPPIVTEGDAHPSHTLAERMAALHVPGVSIAVLHNGKVEWAKGYGVARSDGATVNADTLFQAGSISKPLAALAALRLVEEGRLALDADINAYLTSWKLPASDAAKGKAVTLRELLTHTAGMTVHGFPGYAAGRAVPTVVQVLDGTPPANTPAVRIEAEPGTKWNYSGGGYTIAQQAMVDVTRQPFPKLLHDTVLKPIGMNRSTYEQPLPPIKRSNAAEPFAANGQPIPGGAHTYPEMAAAGLWTTPSELARYAMDVRAAMAGKPHSVVSQSMTRQMLTAGLGGWGLGLQIGGPADNPWFGHGGANEGFRNDFFVYEKSGDGIIIMTNGDNGGALAQEIERAAAEEYRWPDHHPVRAARTTPTPDP